MRAVRSCVLLVVQAVAWRPFKKARVLTEYETEPIELEDSPYVGETTDPTWPPVNSSVSDVGGIPNPQPIMVGGQQLFGDPLSAGLPVYEASNSQTSAAVLCAMAGALAVASTILYLLHH